MTTMRRRSTVLSALVLVACGTQADRPEDSEHAVTGPQQVWWDNMQALCGQAFSGEMVRYDPEMDAGWLNRPVIMHVRECTAAEIRIPLHVGENRSRTWVLTRTADGIQLKHDHRHPDGTEEEGASQYGGHTVDAGSATRQEFPADAESIAQFEARNHPDGVHNVWAMEIHPGERFGYRLNRFNRDFGADFDLTTPVPAPPPPWAIEPQPGA